MEGQQKGLKWQWAWGKVVRAVADWKRQQMEMRKLDWAVEKSVRFGIFFGMVVVVPWRFGVVGFGLLRQRWVRKIDKAVELVESNGR